MYDAEQVNYSNPSVILCCRQDTKPLLFQRRMEWELNLMRKHGADIQYLSSGEETVFRLYPYKVTLPYKVILPR